MYRRIYIPGGLRACKQRILRGIRALSQHIHIGKYGSVRVIFCHKSMFRVNKAAEAALERGQGSRAIAAEAGGADPGFLNPFHYRAAGFKEQQETEKTQKRRSPEAPGWKGSREKTYNGSEIRRFSLCQGGPHRRLRLL